MNQDEVTLGEVGRRMQLIHEDLREMRQAMVSQADLQTALAEPKAALVAHEEYSRLRVQRLDERIADLEAWRAWAVRIVLGAVITAIMGVVLATRL